MTKITKELKLTQTQVSFILSLCEKIKDREISSKEWNLEELDKAIELEILITNTQYKNHESN